MRAPIAYSADLEEPREGEAERIGGLVEALQRILDTTAEDYGPPSARFPAPGLALRVAAARGGGAAHGGAHGAADSESRSGSSKKLKSTAPEHRAQHTLLVSLPLTTRVSHQRASVQYLRIFYSGNIAH